MIGLGDLSEPLLRLAGSIDAIIYVAGREQGRPLRWVSPAVERFFCFTPEEWLADPDALQRHVHPDDRERLRGELSAWLEDGAGEALNLKYRLCAGDGRICWCRESLFAAAPQVVVGAIIDVTELMVLKSTLEAVASAAHPRASVLAFCDAMAQALALGQVGWLAPGRGERLVCSYATPGRRIDERWLGEGEALPGEEVAREALESGRSVWRDDRVAAPVPGARGPQGVLFGQARERGLHAARRQRIAEALAQQLAVALQRADLIVELERTSLDRQRLADELVRAHEAERGRLATELHDGAGQTLTAAMIQLDLAARDVPEAARAPFGAARRQIEQTLEDLRRLSHALRPAALDRLGLTEALLEMCAAMGGPSFAVRVDASRLPPLPPQHAVALFRIAQSALTNVARHASASAAEVRLTHDARSVTLEIADDGRGFDPLLATRSLGLQAMRDRAALLGGTFSLTSAPGSGTTVRAVLPL